MAERIQRQRKPGWRMPEGAVYVGRPSRWGNPFSEFHGRTIGPEWGIVREWPLMRGVCRVDDEQLALYSTHVPSEGAVQAAVDCYRSLAEVRMRDQPAVAERWLAPLVGRDLACWCPLDQPCHADVLLELANGAER